MNPFKRKDKVSDDTILVTGKTSEGKKFVVLKNGKYIEIDKEDLPLPPPPEEEIEQKKIRDSKFYAVKDGKVYIPKDQPDIIEINVEGEKKSITMDKRYTTSEDYELEFDKKTYNIKKDDLLTDDLTFMEKIKSFLRINKIRSRYAIYLDENTKEPKTFSFRAPKWTSRMFYVAIVNRISQLGQQSLPKGGMGFKFDKRLIIVILVITGIIGFVVYGFATGLFKHIGVGFIYGR